MSHTLLTAPTLLSLASPAFPQEAAKPLRA